MYGNPAAPVSHGTEHLVRCRIVNTVSGNTTALVLSKRNGSSGWSNACSSPVAVRESHCNRSRRNPAPVQRRHHLRPRILVEAQVFRVAGWSPIQVGTCGKVLRNAVTTGQLCAFLQNASDNRSTELMS